MAKSRADTPVVAYDPAMGGDALALVSLEADLHVALDRDELLLLFQPIVDLHASRIVGVEALLRWRHPVEGVLTPDRFLPIAEEVGLIVPITRWTIARACRVVGEWRRILPTQTEFCISINLSAAALRDPHLADYVEGVLTQTHTPARALKFELTESGLIRDIRAAKEILERLHEMGIELMLDDFGTGYSSLSHLQFFPFDYVKIDRPLASRSDSTRDAIITAMVRMVSSLGLKTVGEVVETEEGALALRRAGCDFAQGYFFCEPVEAEEALRRLLTQEFRVPRAEPETPHAESRPQDSLAMPVQSDEVAERPIAGPAGSLDDTMMLPLEDSSLPPHIEETMVLAADESQPPTAPLDETQILPIDPFGARDPQSDQTLILPISEDSQTQGLSDETVILPIDESPADATQQLEIDQLGLPYEDSPTLAERIEFLESIDPHNESPESTAPVRPRPSRHEESQEELQDETSWLGRFLRKRRAR
jgi:EAL domain-containing protein (putative c-di-GMP-specific phosphodiesterase class I)